MLNATVNREPLHNALQVVKRIVDVGIDDEAEQKRRAAKKARQRAQRDAEKWGELLWPVRVCIHRAAIVRFAPNIW